MNRSPDASASAFAPFEAAVASRPQMLAMPVAIISRWVALSRIPAWTSASLLAGVSLNHTVP